MSRTDKHVASVINTIDVEGTVANIAQRLIWPNPQNDSASHLFAVVEQWVLSQAKLRYGDQFNFRHLTDKEFSEAHDVASFLYLLFEKKRPTARNKTIDPQKLEKFLYSLESDFVDVLLVELHRREDNHTEFAREFGRARVWVKAAQHSIQRTLRLQQMSNPIDPENPGATDESPGITFKDENESGEIIVGIVGLVIVLFAAWLVAGGPEKLEDWTEDD